MVWLTSRRSSSGRQPVTRRPLYTVRPPSVHWNPTHLTGIKYVLPLRPAHGLPAVHQPPIPSLQPCAPRCLSPSSRQHHFTHSILQTSLHAPLHSRFRSVYRFGLHNCASHGDGLHHPSQPRLRSSTTRGFGSAGNVEVQSFWKTGAEHFEGSGKTL